MFYVNFFCLLFFFYASFQAQVVLCDSSLIGPYIVSPSSQIFPCKGPKAINATRAYIDFLNLGEGAILAGNITVLIKTRLEEMKLSMKNPEMKKNKELFYKFQNPCQHFFVENIFKMIYHKKNCIIEKGFYKFVLDINKYIHYFAGNNFLYGTYSAKAVGVSKKENLFCIMHHVKVIKA